jgi:hypothetical protein
VTHPQARVAALLDVTLRSTESSDEKVAQPLLGARKIVPRIHGTEDIVFRHLPVERGDEPREPFFADRRVDILIVHHPFG